MEQVVFITGAARGIGRKTAEKLLDKGFHLYATDIDDTGLKSSFDEVGKRPGRIRLKKMDVSRPDDWRECVQDCLSSYGKIDCLINNAAIIRPSSIWQTTFEDIDAQVNINLKSVLFGTSSIGAVMKEQGSGHIINIASLAGVAPVPGLGVYSATKYGVRAYSLIAANELREYGVLVTAVCPDLVDTHMLDVQLHHEEAAIAFSGNHIMDTEYLSEQIIRTIGKDKLQLFIPNSRGILAKLSDTFPGINAILRKSLHRKGMKRWLKLNKSRNQSGKY